MQIAVLDASTGNPLQLLPWRCAGVIVQFLTGIFESGLWRWKYPSAALDMDSPQVTKFAKRWNEITTRWVRKPRWAYFHVGQVRSQDCALVIAVACSKV